MFVFYYSYNNNNDNYYYCYYTNNVFMFIIIIIINVNHHTNTILVSQYEYWLFQSAAARNCAKFTSVAEIQLLFKERSCSSFSLYLSYVVFIISFFLTNNYFIKPGSI